VPDPRSCGHCGKIFVPPAAKAAAGQGRFCSQPCRVAGMRVHPVPEPRVCALDGCDLPASGTAWHVANGYGKYCSHAHYSLAITKVVEERACESCGGPLSHRALRAGRPFCSEACAIEGRRVYPVPERQSCARPGCDRVCTPSGANVARGQGRYCGHACALRDMWRVGRGMPVAGISSHYSGRARQRWHGRWSGHLGAAGGIEAGKAKGGRTPKATPEQQSQMYELMRQGLSSRAIARIVFGEARFYYRVVRFARR
jgi:hypothetical protein